MNKILMALKNLGTALSAKKSSASIFLDNLQKLIQVVAIIIAGLWALKEFYAFQDRNNALTLEQQKLGVKQAELTTRQIEIALQQADVVKRQQELTLENTKLSNEGQQLANRLSLKKISQSDDPRFSISLQHGVVDLKEHEGSQHLYYVTTAATVKNTSEESIEITSCLFANYFGQTDTSKLNFGEANFINAPSSLFDRPRSGPVKYRLINSSARAWNKGTSVGWFRTANITIPDSEILNGGCSGQIPANDSLTYAEAYLLKANPTDLLGYGVDFYFEKFGFWRWRSRSDFFGTAAKDKVDQTK